MYSHICTRVFLIALAFSFLIPQTSAETVSTGIIIPLYTNPGPAWNAVIQEKTAHPSVPVISIINPDNGPGQFDPSYLAGIQQLQSAGILVLGYVDTLYGSKNTTSVESEINSYNTWYHVNGIFFDEMSYVAGDETYYSGLTRYSKSLGMTITVGNPGIETVPSYVGTVDNIVTYENVGLPPLSALDGWHTSYAKGNFSMIAFGVNELNESFVKYASNYVGYMYVTNYTLPNPYYNIPLYLDNLFVAIYQNTSSCLPPASGDWEITSRCILGSSAIAPANVIVDTGTVLTIPNGLRLDIDFTHHHLLVRAGGGVLIKAGGAIN